MNGVSDGRDRRTREWRSLLARSWSIGLVGAPLSLPLLAACAWLARRHWAPVYDMALFEMHVRDVGTRNTPLLGLAGRLSRLPNVGCHPGPLAFYAFAPPYRLFGSSFWALRAVTTLSAVVAVLASLWIARRRTGTPGVVALGVVLAVLELGFGLLTFTEPWNPYVPVPWFVAFLLAIWSVIAGDVLFLPVAAMLGSFCGQTHISYLPVCGSLSAAAFLLVAIKWAREPVESRNRRTLGIACASTLALTIVVWSPPLLEEWRSPRGNLTILFDYFRNPPEPPIGFRRGIDLLLQHLDVWTLLEQSFGYPGFFREALAGSTQALDGAFVLFAWIASSAMVVRRGNRILLPLHATVAAALCVACVAESRIIGFPFAHVVFFSWCTGGFVLFALLSNVACFVDASTARIATAAAVSFIAVCTVRVVGAMGRAGARHAASSLQLAVLAQETIRSIESGRGVPSGKLGPYLITWEDALYGGAQAYGLLLELERGGVSAFVADNGFNRALVGAHRVMDPKRAAARIHFVNGAWIQETHNKPGATQIAYWDTRTPAEILEYRKAAATLAIALAKIGHPEFIVQIERNFHSIANSGLSTWDVLRAEKIAEIGMPAAVFVLPTQ